MGLNNLPYSLGRLFEMWNGDSTALSNLPDMENITMPWQPIENEAVVLRKLIHVGIHSYSCLTSSFVNPLFVKSDEVTASVEDTSVREIGLTVGQLFRK
jgi:hypothetical protein